MNNKHKKLNTILDWLEKNKKTNILIKKDTPLLTGDVLDSLGLMQLIALIQEITHTSLDINKIKTEQFQTLSDIEKHFLK